MVDDKEAQKSTEKRFLKKIKEKQEEIAEKNKYLGERVKEIQLKLLGWKKKEQYKKYLKQTQRVSERKEDQGTHEEVTNSGELRIK